MFQKMCRTSTHAVQCATLIAPYKVLAPSFPHDFSGKTSEAKFRACAHPVRGSAFNRYLRPPLHSFVRYAQGLTAGFPLKSCWNDGVSSFGDEILHNV
jgi:hypothetical protein